MWAAISPSLISQVQYHSGMERIPSLIKVEVIKVEVALFLYNNVMSMIQLNKFQDRTHIQEPARKGSSRKKIHKTESER